MASLYETVTKEHFDELCAGDDGDEWLRLVAGASVGLRKRKFQPAELVDAMGQYATDEPPLSEVYAFLQLWMHIVEGHLFSTRLHIGHVPFRDRFVTENDALLQQLSQRSGIACETRFWGGSVDEDGYVRLNQEIELASPGATSAVIRYGGKGSVDFPLEVGTCSWSKTCILLRSRGLLARWPYGSEDIWLLKMSDGAMDALAERRMKKMGIAQ